MLLMQSTWEFGKVKQCSQQYYVKILQVLRALNLIRVKMTKMTFKFKKQKVKNKQKSFDTVFLCILQATTSRERRTQNEIWEANVKKRKFVKLYWIWVDEASRCRMKMTLEFTLTFNHHSTDYELVRSVPQSNLVVESHTSPWQPCRRHVARCGVRQSASRPTMLGSVQPSSGQLEHLSPISTSSSSSFSISVQTHALHRSAGSCRIRRAGIRTSATSNLCSGQPPFTRPAFVGYLFSFALSPLLFAFASSTVVQLALLFAGLAFRFRRCWRSIFAHSEISPEIRLKFITSRFFRQLVQSAAYAIVLAFPKIRSWSSF